MVASKKSSIIGQPSAFSGPIYVTRPSMPSLIKVQAHLKDIWESRILSNQGPKCCELELRLKTLLQCSNIKLFCNGTLGLTLALRALNVTGEVVTTPFTFPATPHAIAWAGGTPVFADIKEDSLCLDPAAIEAMIGPNTEAILGVHVYGIPCDVFSIQKIADRHGLKVIYDAAHAFMTEIDGQPIASFGDASMFSFHATKLFHTVEGGAVAFNDSDLGEQLDLLRNFGIEDEKLVTLSGTNAKLNELQSAIGIEMIPEAIQERLRRESLRKLYVELFSEVVGISCVLPPKDVLDSLQYMVVRVNESEYGLNADDLCEKMKKYNIYARRYFYPLCSDYLCYADHKKDDLVSASMVASEVVCLPFYGELAQSDVERIVGVIKYIQGNRF